MKFTEILKHINGVISAEGDADITGLKYDSRRVTPGDAFFCLPGVREDGHDYAAQAVKNGASALVCQRPLELGVPYAVVGDTQAALSYAAAAMNGFPAKGMRIIGVTGTKGKTSTSILIKAILDSAGVKTGLTGSISTLIGQKEIYRDLNTPDAPDFHAMLAQMRAEGIDTLVMEVSANAMAQERLAGVRFAAGVFTNFAQDHLEYFGTMEKYFAAKKLFIDPKYIDFAVINADDEKAGEMASGVTHEFYGIANQHGAYASDIDVTENGLVYTLIYDNVVMPIRLNLSGLFNVYNSMAAAVTCLKLGIGAQHVVNGLAGVKNVPGRIELLDTSTPYKVILDYAHTPGSLQSVLKAVRQFTKGRLIAVFGCGGNRDHEKRPLMGEAAGELADYTIITSDNPRSEEPAGIIAQIEEGMKRTGGIYETIEDREQAIQKALSMAKPGDTVILAGKGHETYQEIMGQKRPFDEREVVARLLTLQRSGEGGA